MSLQGPYIKWFLEKLQPDGLCRLLTDWEDKRARAVCTLAFAESANETPVIFQGVVEGMIVCPRGSSDFGWDPIFQPQDHTKTFAEMNKEEKNKISHRSLAVEAFRKHFIK